MDPSGKKSRASRATNSHRPCKDPAPAPVLSGGGKQRSNRLVAHWALSAADQVAETTEATRAKARTKSQFRRDDLNHVEAAFPPTARDYPAPRNDCQPEQNGTSLLTAASGRQ